MKKDELLTTLANEIKIHSNRSKQLCDLAESGNYSDFETKLAFSVANGHDGQAKAYKHCIELIKEIEV